MNPLVFFLLHLPVLGNKYNDVDASTEYMVTLNKGLLFERTGTIFSYPQMNLLTVVVFRIAITPRAPDPVLPDYACNYQTMPNAYNVTRPTQSMYFPKVP